MKIRTRYEHKGTKCAFTCKTPSMAFQSEKQDTMIESYLRRYRATGFLGDPARKAAATFGDFSGLEDYQTIQNKMCAVKEHFEALPSNIRRFFGDEPANFVSFVTNPANFQKAIEMGLISSGEIHAPSQSTPPQNPSPVEAMTKETAAAAGEAERAVGSGS